MLLHVSGEVMRRIREKLQDDRKIQAIKELRTETKCGLREAKQAVERMQYEEFNRSPPPEPNAPKIIGMAYLKAVRLDFGDGEVEVNLEQLQLEGLMKLERIGLDACRNILELVDILQAWQEGKTIRIAEEEVPDVEA